MKNRIFILSLIAGFLSLGACSRNCQTTDSKNYVEVTGTATKEATPDLFTLSITIDESDYKGTTTVETLEKRLFNTLVKFNIDVEKSLTITDLSSNYDWYWWRKKTKPTTRKRYELKLDSIRTFENICQALEKETISNIYLSKAEYSKIDELHNQVKVEAVKNAKQNAEILATSANQKIGKPILIQEQPVENYGRYRNSQFEYADKEADNYNVDFRKISIEYTVLTRFEIK